MKHIPETPSRLRITPIARLAVGGKWRVESMRALREPVFLWFTSGQGRITVAGTTRGYGTHNAIYIPPGTLHGFEVGLRAHGTAVFFGSDHSPDLPSAPVHLRIRESGPQKEITGILENIQREADSGRAGSVRAARHHLGLLEVWLERQIGAHDATPASLDRSADCAQRLSARYASLLERDFRTNSTVADYAAALGITPTHLSRVCKATSGRTAHALLQDRIVYEARRLLTETAHPVKDVAHSLGFSTPGYFTRMFQHNTGTTPTAFRKTQPHQPLIPRY
ncbi:helix-turn-helix domain-containing protein [Roseicitreum antarcticum]|uniref:AraC-type DNA-binding protein n=1 Tax=Roseicitreum antarcticum TaxID=564137 RepID=A0A1H2VTI4_9RHOB|nr:AraC family transcriptional regulator [Roseicitreum antarcticum]SDW71665.1 AraC-type DNA-binding protein [Roseicitreum antarcticum]